MLLPTSLESRVWQGDRSVITARYNVVLFGIRSFHNFGMSQTEKKCVAVSFQVRSRRDVTIITRSAIIISAMA